MPKRRLQASEPRGPVARPPTRPQTEAQRLHPRKAMLKPARPGDVLTASQKLDPRRQRLHAAAAAAVIIIANAANAANAGATATADTAGLL